MENKGSLGAFHASSESWRWTLLIAKRSNRQGAVVTLPHPSSRHDGPHSPRAMRLVGATFYQFAIVGDWVDPQRQLLAVQFGQPGCPRAGAHALKFTPRLQ